MLDKTVLNQVGGYLNKDYTSAAFEIIFPKYKNNLTKAFKSDPGCIMYCSFNSLRGN